MNSHRIVTVILLAALLIVPLSSANAVCEWLRIVSQKVSYVLGPKDSELKSVGTEVWAAAVAEMKKMESKRNLEAVDDPMLWNAFVRTMLDAAIDLPQQKCEHLKLLTL